MAGPYDFTGQNIENTYQRVLQTPDGGATIYDGTGSLVNLTATATAGGSNTQIQFNSASLLSGSSNFTFDYTTNALTLTGSLNITGSTIQIGNNNLFGNTELSGSIIISGAAGTNNPTVRIYGDTIHDGYIRFDPVSTNIDPTISASYIYVSGSTNDLYFTQNGAGYGNTTRLRWLEGNLYTGLLHGGLISSASSTTFNISSGSGIIVNLNASLTVDPYPTIQFVEWGNLTNQTLTYRTTAIQTFLGIDSNGQIVQQTDPWTDGQYNTSISLGTVLHQNLSTINGTISYPNVAYGWKQRSYDFVKAFGPLKISGFTLRTSSSLGLTVDGGVAFAEGRNYQFDPSNPSYCTDTGTTVSKIFRYYQSGSTFVQDTNGGLGYTDVDTTQFNLNGSGSLIAVSPSKFYVHRIFWYPKSVTKGIVDYYGLEAYDTLDEAQTKYINEPFVEVPNTQQNAIFLGIVIVKGNSNFNNANDYRVVQGGLFRSAGVGGGSGGGGATTLAGLTDVSLTSPTYGDLLMYDTNVWINTKTLSGSYTLSGSLTTNDGVKVQSLTASFISASSITGSLLGTASYATTASYALNGGVTQLLAGSNISLSPTNGLGQVTISSTGGGGVYGNTATGSYGSFYSTQTQTVPSVNAILSMSINTTDISNGVSISGSTNPFNTYIKTENAGVYDIQFSTQLDKLLPGGTDTVYIWLRKNGTDLAETNTAVELSQNGKAVAAWNWFVNSAANDYYQIMWSANTTNVQLTATSPSPIGPGVPSVIVTVNRVDQFLSNTGSFSGSFVGTHTGSFTGSFTGSLFGTSSWAQSSSIAISSSYALTSSVSNVAYSASIIANNATNAAYLLPFTDRLVALNTQTGSVQLQTDQNLYYNPNTNTLSVIASQANSASYALNSTSASYALSASYAPVGPGQLTSLALWNSTSTITSSSLYSLTDNSATDLAVVSESLINVISDGVKIQSSFPNTLPSSSNSNIFVNNTSPAGGFIEIPKYNYSVIKYLDLYQYNINDKGGCFGLILDFNLMLGPDAIGNLGDQNSYLYDENSWPNFTYPSYVETGRIYLSWLGADPTKGGAVGRFNNVTYITMNPTITNASSAGWEVVAAGIPSATSLAASEEGVVAPYGAPTYRDQNLGYQFGYKLVNDPLNSLWYVEVALYNDTDAPIRITHTTKILNLFI